jgi:small subunit ribosomal protein S20
MAKEAETKKTRRPTAQKRDIQSKARNERNRVYKSRIRTAERHLEDAIKAGNPTTAKEQLDSIYSLMDKGVKKGVLKANQASRTKSRLTHRALATAK